MELTTLLNTLSSGRIYCGEGHSPSPFEVAKAISPRPCDFRRLVTEIESLLASPLAVSSASFDSHDRTYEMRLIRIENKTIACLQEHSRERDLANFQTLSKRETEVLDHLVQGLSNKQTAAALFLSPRTVEKHRANILRKMGTHSLAVLTRMWLDQSEGPERAAA